MRPVHSLAFLLPNPALINNHSILVAPCLNRYSPRSDHISSSRANASNIVKFGVIRNLSNAVSWPTSVEDEEDGNVNGDLDVEDDVDGLSLVLVRLGGFSSMISIRGGGRLGGVDLRRRVGHDRIGLSILPAFDIEGLEEIGSHFIVWLCGQIGGDQENASWAPSALHHNTKLVYCLEHTIRT
ncbi:hypothetical protein NLI96_g11559 [Meripilus lineatus]|uniref:Uncharacterized protein n=1 Tax=Meripilus lineatus TaxID=2056292 RepID=A0AAD5URJ9_9APHY|nr:hypothetical protein NLI96_g11559 [Physisporinus lineatus]